MTRSFAVIVELDDALEQDAAGVDRAPASEIARAALAAERAGVTAVSFQDHPTRIADGARYGRLDAVLRAASVAPLTGSIGLLPVVHALYNEPFHVATQLASLDTASLGRGGWIAAADPDAAIAARHGRDPLPRELADAELVDVVEAVRRLWDTWEDDAVVRDVASGRYLDREKVHYADFAGERFSVKGPSIIPRSPQGQPVVIGAAGSSAELDAALVDVAAQGAGALAFGPAAVPAVASAAAASLATARDQLPDGVLLIAQLGFALDSAGLPARERLAATAAAPTFADSRARFAGPAHALTDLLAAIAGIADGVRLFPAHLGIDLDELGRAVLPELRRRDVFRSPRAGETLRTTLGLARPANRFAAARGAGETTDDTIPSATDRLEVAR